MKLTDADVKANGRGLKKPAMGIMVTADGIKVRIDDEQNPEFWFELWVSSNALAVLLAQSIGQLDTDQSAVLQALHEVRLKLAK